MDKIKMLSPIVEMDGDEMTRILWQQIKDELLCISIFLRAEPRNILNGNLTRQIAGLGTREYGPRVLTELFEDKD